MNINLSPLTFQFHDIAAARITTDNQTAHNFFKTEYYYHLRESTPEVGNNLLLNSLEVKELPCLDLKFTKKTLPIDGYTRHVHKVFAQWSYKLEISQRYIGICANGNKTSVPMVHHMLLHPSLRYLSCGTDNLLLHAGAVVKNNKSLIFTGKGGTGKTTTTSIILASSEDWQIHADDYIFLSNELSKAYVTRSHLYRDLKHWIPKITDQLTFWEQIKLEVLGYIRKSSQEKIKWPVRVEPNRLWPGLTIADTAIPSAIILLERQEIGKPELIHVNNLDETTEDLLEMNFGEAKHFIQLLRKAGSLDEQWLSSWKNKERSLISNCVHKIPVFRLVLPFANRTSVEIQSSLMPFLNDLVS